MASGLSAKSLRKSALMKTPCFLSRDKKNRDLREEMAKLLARQSMCLSAMKSRSTRDSRNAMKLGIQLKHRLFNEMVS